jgi:hypothetical protein
MRKLRLPIFFVAFAGLALLAACGSGVSGTYTDKATGNQWTFKNGKVTVSNSGMSMGGYTYKVKGKKVVMTAPAAAGGVTLEFDIGKDGCLTGPGILGEACKA